MSVATQQFEVRAEALQTAGKYHQAIILSVVLSALLTITSLLVPPSMSHDAAWGMREWATYSAGGPMNTIITPSPADISRDKVGRVTWWSPGQYLIPGLLTLTGLRLGAALSIVSGLSLLCCLLGWIRLAKHFNLSPRTTILMVALIATFRYSTIPFNIYNGGEILLQGLTPWLILVGCIVPSLGVLRAAGLAFAAILIAFFAKLTGLMVVSAALFAGAVECLIRIRRITAGMVAGAIGAFSAFAVLYFFWFAHGTTPASGTGWAFRLGDVLFAMGAPFGAGVSWTDMLVSVISHLRHTAASGGDEIFDLRTILLLLLVPVVLFGAVLVKGWREYSFDARLRRLLIITAAFYVICSTAISEIFLHGGDVSVEERHLRAAGVLILFCVLAVVERLPRRSVSRFAVWSFCGLMAFYGCLAFAYRARSTKRASIDQRSGIYLPNVDESAMDSLRSAFLKDGRDDLFVLPSPDAASVFAPEARVLANHIEYESEETIAAQTYHGRVRGRLYVLVPSSYAQTPKATLLLKEFVDCPFNGWGSESFGDGVVFVQEGVAKGQ